MQVPVIVIGNITLGGTGKTPLVIHLANELKKNGYHPGIISRGYGAKGNGISEVNQKSNVENVGDEPILIQKHTRLPVLVNTSFNVRGEPIVCSATDAFNCFMGTDLDVLVCNNFILYKDNQNKDLLKDYKNKYELD